MVTDANAVRTYFGKLGLGPEVADIYLALYSHGPQTISELSRSSKVERTRIYRLLDKLMESNLIEVESHYKRGVIKAAPIANLNILISEKEQELKSLQDELELIQRVLAHNSLSNPTTRVQFYSGLEGYKQVLWNESKAKSEVVCFVESIIQPRAHKAFFERWVAQCNANNVHFREIHGDAFRKSHKEWYETHNNLKLDHYDGRYISDTDFPLTHSWDIYDDVVAYYSWKNGEVFGLEIHNKDIADVQRRFFEMMWPKAVPETRV